VAARALRDVAEDAMLYQQNSTKLRVDAVLWLSPAQSK
jgi:hypothetical protein